MTKNRYISKEETEKKSSDKQKKKKRKMKTVSESTISKQSRNVAQIMSGDFLTRDFMLNNLNFIFFIIFLMILLVSKGYYVHQLANDINKERKLVEDITADYVETKAELEERTKRAQLIKKLQPLGLKETVNPTRVIRIKKEEKEEKK